MKITVLGNNGPYPRAGGACSGYLLETEHTKILLDCGNGTLSRLQQKINIFADLDMIILTHLHSDHISDALVLKYALGIRNIKGAQKSIPLYAPNEPKGDFEKLQYHNAYELKTIEESMEISHKGLSIKFKRMDHPVECYGLQVIDKNKKFVYSGDTRSCEAILELADKADLLLCEAGLLEKDKTATTAHLSAKEAGEIGAKCQVKKLLLTHFWPEYDLEEIYKEAKTTYEGDLELSKEMESYVV